MKDYLTDKLNSLTEDQRELYNLMLSNDKLQICIPTDVGSGSLESDLAALNKLDEKSEKYDLIEEVTHEIELLVKEEEDSKEAIRLNSLSKLELLKEKLKF